MTAKIATKETKHGTIVVDAIDADILETARPFAGQGSRRYVYAYSRRVDGKNVQPYLHRFIVERMTGAPIPKGMVVDHANGDTFDNRRSNLRLCTQSQNRANQRLGNSSSGFKGVSWHKQAGKWCARIKINKRAKHIGLFDTPEQAHAAYVAVARELFGEFANDGNGCLLLRSEVQS